MSRHLHSLRDPDPFSPEDGYSPDQLMTPACDDKGHTAQKRIAFKPDVFPVLAQIVASGQFDYRSPEDIVRDAVYHRIWFLAGQLGVTYRKGKLQGDLRHVVTGASVIAEIERIGAQRAERLKYVETLEKEIDECRRSRDGAGVRALIAHARTRLDEDWLRDPYRSQVETIIDKAAREVW